MSGYSNPAAGSGYDNPQGVGASGDAPDATHLWQQVHDRVIAALSAMPRDKAESIATGIANGVVSQYQNELKKGTEPGVAIQVAQSWEQTWTENAQRQNGIDPKTGAGNSQATPAGAPGAGASASAVAPDDVKNAQQQYVEGITKGQQTYKDIINSPTNSPGARSTFKAIGTPQSVQSIAAPKLGSATQQLATQVKATDTSALDATASGQGAGQQTAAARYQQMLLNQGQALNASAAQARGKDRAAARLAAMSNQGEAGVAAGAKIAESDAQTSLAAQSKVADISSQRNTLQAQLDEAKASGDANRIQEITKKLADLTLDTAKANADISAGNIDRTVGVQEKNNAGALAAEVAGGNQDVAQNDLRLRAQKALEDSAHGVLTEDSRQEAIAMARKQLALAEQQLRMAADEAARARASQDRAFWTTTLTSLLALGVTAVGGPVAGAGVAAAAKAAHGGAVESARTIVVGEAGNPEIIVPVRGKLSQRLAAALAIEARPFEPDGPKEIDTPDQLTSAIKKTLQGFRAKMAKKTEVDDEDAVSEMAAATLRARRARGTS